MVFRDAIVNSEVVKIRRFQRQPAIGVGNGYRRIVGNTDKLVVPKPGDFGRWVCINVAEKIYLLSDSLIENLLLNLEIWHAPDVDLEVNFLRAGDVLGDARICSFVGFRIQAGYPQRSNRGSRCTTFDIDFKKDEHDDPCNLVR